MGKLHNILGWVRKKWGDEEKWGTKRSVVHKLIMRQQIGAVTQKGGVL